MLKLKFPVSLSLAVAASLTGLPAAAQSWTGNGTDGNFTTGANWTGGVAPVSGASLSLDFPTPVGAQVSPVVDVPYTVRSIGVGGPVPYSFSGADLTFNSAPSAAFGIASAGHTMTNNLILAADTVFFVSADMTLGGTVLGLGLLTKRFSGTLTLAGTGPHVRSSIEGGILRVGNGITGPVSTGPIAIVDPSGELQLNTPGGVSIASTSGTGIVTAVGGSAIIPTMAQSGPILVNTVAQLSGTSISTSARLHVHGIISAVDFSVGSLVGTGVINVNGGTLTVGSDNASTVFNGLQIGTTGGVTKVGTGTLTLAHSNTYTGLTRVLGGTLAIGNGIDGPPDIFAINNDAAIEFNVPTGITLNNPMSGSGTVRFAGGVASSTALLGHAGTTTVDAGAVFNGAVVNAARLTVNGTMNSNGTVNVGSLAGSGAGQLRMSTHTFTTGFDGTDSVYSGAELSGTGIFRKLGAGRQTIAETIAFGGQTSVQGGTLIVGNGVAGPPTIGDIQNDSAVEFNVPGVGIQLLNGMTGTGSVRVVGGSATVTGALTHQGTTTIDNGAALTARISNNALLSIAGNVVTTGATTVGSLTGGGGLDIFATFTAGGDNSSRTFVGQITGNGNLVKAGTGVMTLSGVSNSYTGGTNVNAGILLVTGFVPGPTNVLGPATLGGTGTLGGPTLIVDGRLAPGLSPGALTVPNLTLNGILMQEIQGPAIGTQYDTVNVNGQVTIGAAATLTLTGAFVPPPGSSFVILANDGVDPVVGTFAGLPEGATIPFNGVPLRITYVGGTGNDVVLISAAPAAIAGDRSIPTMSQWMLALLALAMLAIAWRRSR